MNSKDLIINGDILNSEFKFIIHQCNCVTKNTSAGLAKLIFNKFPYSNVYNRSIDSKPGSIEIRGNGVADRYIVAFYSQVYPGKPKFPESTLDGHKAREKLFQLCLTDLSKVENLESVAFPFQIGCGLAQGNWDNYLQMIFQWYVDINKNQLVDVKILQL